MWVNDLGKDDFGGYVYTLETFNKNIAIMQCEQQVINELKNLQEDQKIIFKIVGRYFCMIDITKDKSLRKMTFFNFKTREIAFRVFDNILKEDKALAKEFTDAYVIYESVYNEGYNQVELRVDVSAIN